LLWTAKTSLGFWNSRCCRLDVTTVMVLQETKAIYYKRNWILEVKRILSQF